MKRTWLQALLAILLLLSMVSCGEYKPAIKPPEDGTSEEDTSTTLPEGDADPDPEETPFTVTLYAEGEVFVPTEPIYAQWTDGYSFHQAPFDETGKAQITGLDGDYRVTLSAIPEGYSYDANSYVSTNEKRDVSIELYPLVSYKKRGSDLYSNIIEIRKMGVYRTELKKEGQVVYFQFAPTKSGTYSIETWVDITQNEINPQLEIYNGSTAYKVYAYTLDDGAASAEYTKNVRFEVKIDQAQIGSVYAFGVKASVKDGEYPVYVDFALQLNGSFSMERTKYKMMLPMEIEKVRAADRNGLLQWSGTLVGPETKLGKYNVFEGDNYKLNPQTGLYHRYDADTNTYGAILYAYITQPCRFIDKAFSVVEYEGNKALTVSRGTECYKLFIEGYSALVSAGYDTSWQVGLSSGELTKYASCSGYQAVSNGDGVVPVTEEIKVFLQKYSVSQTLFRDGEGWVEENPDVDVDALEEDQWLFACAYYAEDTYSYTPAE
ncbi:MAG: hypothetical protein IJX13_00305 [Clostridia bacterium]|nr:hypothetical protein [Clostridia bacterium]